MTKEEIKERYSMREIIARYGLYPNRSGFISCPFHKGDREASMKIYDKDFHCLRGQWRYFFVCSADGRYFFSGSVPVSWRDLSKPHIFFSACNIPGKKKTGNETKEERTRSTRAPTQYQKNRSIPRTTEKVATIK
jgi:hypothetical protein